MPLLSEEFASGEARLRVDVHGSEPLAHILDDMTFLNYRLASVEVVAEPTGVAPHVVWHRDVSQKSIHYEDQTLILGGNWFQGELQKIIVSALALQMEKVGLHPFHSSAVRFRDRTIMFMSGEANHGKTMCQIEGCRRGGLVVSTETTVTDERGWAVMGSKNVFLKKRAKGTERTDIPDAQKGAAKFFDEAPTFVNYDEPSDVDLVILPAIDGNFDTQVVEMIPFEKEYQTYHSLANYFGLAQLLASGHPMPMIDTDELRFARADFCSRFAQRTYYLIRAKNPQLVLDEVEKLA
jgi:hypothetical protein